MKRIICFISALMLTGCFGDKQELAAFIARIKSTDYTSSLTFEPLPQFTHFHYQATSLRSPFVTPVNQESQLMLPDITCHQPMQKQHDVILNKYTLAELSLQGTLTDNDNSWGLITAENNAVYTVKVGDYVGANQGRVLAVLPHELKIVELISDGTDCWVEHQSSLTLYQSN